MSEFLSCGPCEGGDDTGRDPAAIIAGTLCLMSCYAQHPLALYARRVTDNLARLADGAAMTPELRAVCRRLSAQWEGIADEAARDAAAGIAREDLRALH